MLEHLTSERTLIRSVVWNFIGLGAPLLVGLYSIPLLIDGMGTERFGVLSIIWMGVGYFSLFDLGLGRALTKSVSEALSTEKKDDLGSLIWTALWLMLSLGVGGAVVLFVLSRLIINNILSVNIVYVLEAENAFRLLSLGIPFVIISSALKGLLEARQQFGSISAISIPLGLVTFLGPLMTLQFSPSLVWATAIILVGRMFATFMFYIQAKRKYRELLSPQVLSRVFAVKLFSFGGWLTVTNIIGPLMVYFDRFFLGAMMSMTAVTYYVTPFEILSKVLIISTALMGVFFPALSATYAADRAKMASLYWDITHVLMVVMLPIMSFFYFFAPEMLNLWLGNTFMEHSTIVVKWLCLGWLVNALAQPAFTVLQSSGRPDLVAKTHLLELAPYAYGLWYLTSRFGIAGTAMAWSLRALVDMFLLNMLVFKTIKDLRKTVKRFGIELVSIVGIAWSVWWVSDLNVRIWLFAVVVFVAFYLAVNFIRQLMGHVPKNANKYL